MDSPTPPRKGTGRPRARGTARVGAAQGLTPAQGHSYDRHDAEAQLGRLADQCNLLHASRHEQAERARELECLLRIARMAGDPHLDLAQALQQIAHTVPAAYPYPQRVQCAISCSGLRVASPGVSSARPARAIPIPLEDGGEGRLEIRIRPAHGRTIAPPADREVALLQALAAEVARAVALRRGQADYQQLVDHMQQGFALHQVIRNARGQVVDYRFVEVNGSFERLTGLSRHDILGRSVTEVLPATERLWIDRYAEVTNTRRPVRFESYSQALDRHFAVEAYSPKPEHFAVIVTDITDRRLAEEQRLLHAQRLRSLTRILEYRTQSHQELLEMSIEEAMLLTGSPVGFMFTHRERGLGPELQAWYRDARGDFTPLGAAQLLQLRATKLWAPEVLEGQEVVWNGATRGPTMGSEAHPLDVQRLIALPLCIQGKPQAVLGVANRNPGYHDTDLQQLRLLVNSVQGMIQRLDDREQIAKLSNAVEQSSASVVITSPQGNIEYVNAKFTAITGYTREEVMGMNPRVLKSGVHGSEFYTSLWRTITEGREWRGQMVNRAKGGELFWEAASISPVFNSRKEIISFIAIKEDITELKRAEEAQRRSEQKLRLMIEQSPDGIMLTNEEGVVVQWNSAMERITSIPSPTAIGLHIADLFLFLSPEGYSKRLVRQAASDLLAHGDSIHFPTNTLLEVAIRIDGQRRVSQLIVFTIPSDRGRMMACFTRDITAHKQAERAIRDSEERLRAIFNNSLLSFIIFDADLRVQAFNHVAQARAMGFFGTQMEVGMAMRHLYPSQRVRQFEDIMRGVLAGQTLTLENSLTDSQGGERWFEYHFAPVRDARQEVASIFFSSLDITERKQAEESMAKALQREKELGDLKSRFVATVSHEFRTPLASIYSNAQLLERYLEKWDAHTRQGSFARIYESVRTMTAMLEDVSLIGREQTGNLTYRPEVLNLNQLLEQTVADAHLTVKHRDRIDLAMGGSYTRVLIDRVLLSHILNNVLTNALKYSEGKPNVQLTLTDDGKHLAFEVVDFGIGIPPEEVKYIFDPFFRASNSAEFSGTGLGMAVAKQCVGIHGGTIDVASRLGQGTRVTVRLPLRVAEAERGG